MVSLVIVDYKSLEKTINYINSCINHIIDNELLNIIIVDNSCNKYYEKVMNDLINTKKCVFINRSNFGDKNFCQYIYNEKNLIIIETQENLGYAKGNNLGVKVAKEIFNDKYVIFSNNDLRFTSNIYLSDFLQIIKSHNDIAVIGPKIVGLDGKAQSPRKENGIWKQLILYFPSILFKNFLYSFINNIDYDDKSKYVYWVMGCFVFVDLKKFEEVGMFDENTFLYAEEMILSERLKNKNYKNYFFNEIEIIHEHGQTVKDTFSIIKGMEISFNSNYYYFEHYIKSNVINLKLAKFSFRLFKSLLPIKEKVNSIIRRKL